MCGGGEPCFDGLQPLPGPNGSSADALIPHLGEPDLGVLSGLDVVAVGGFYGALAAVSAAVLGLRHWRRRRRGGQGAGHGGGAK